MSGIRMGHDSLRDHLTMTCGIDCVWCAKRARIEDETCEAAPADDPGHCSHWDEYEPCCRCGDNGRAETPGSPQQNGSQPPTVADEHTCFIGNDFLSDAWETSCSCGWVGREWPTQDEAYEDWENHCDVAFMESTMQGADDV